jgi:hypothetical protein
MNKQEILRHISGFCPDITVDGERYVYTENNFMCGLEIMDNAIVLFYPHYNKEKCELYSGINDYNDIIDVWSEYRYRLQRANNKLVKSSR